MKKLFYLSVATAMLLAACKSPANKEGSHKEYGDIVLKSPDGKNTVYVDVREDGLYYTVLHGDSLVLLPSTFSFEFTHGAPLGDQLEVAGEERQTIDEIWEPVVGRYAEVRNHCNELTLHLREKKFPGREFDMVFRAYDDGVAFRYVFPEQDEKPDMNIQGEHTRFVIPGDRTAWMADYLDYHSHQESEFFQRKLSCISNQKLIGLPLLIKYNESLYVALTEAALDNWPGFYVGQKMRGDEVVLCTKLAPMVDDPHNLFKAKFELPHASPWRVLMIGETPGELVESELIKNLNPPCAYEDPSWIKPGLCAWDHWWHDGVQMDTKTIKEYIDLAAEMGWPYMLIDWQWYGQFKEPESDVTTVNPEVNMPEVLAYAKEKGVRCWLWLYYTDINKKMEEAFALFEKWGVAGVKIDFMARDDQETVAWYKETVKLAAKYHLMVNFHGAYKPTGIERTYPNLMTREGVIGNEYNKWSTRVTPEYTTTIPFTRMLVGPMDFTPGGFLNSAKGQFSTEGPTRVQGTRSHQLAMFVVYDSPICTMADHPDNYKGQTGVEFLKTVPAVWDDTKVLDGRVGEYIAMARRSGDRWFIGAMTNSQARELTIKLDFLENGSYTMTSYSDTEESATDGMAVAKESVEVKAGKTYTIKMAPGGGFAAWLEPLK